MNKDVIYIEPEHDITDILANIKGAKSKIVALVPPKKSTVLRSAVNFKLIAKAATKSEKTVVLITSDESLIRLANNVKMPTAKTLQSKPKLPELDDAAEFGDEEEPEASSEEVIDDDAATEEEAKDTKAEKTAKKKDGKKTPSAADIAEASEDSEKNKDDDVEEIIDDEDEEKKSKAKPVAKKNTKVPNFKKYRKFILIGAVVIVLLTALLVWANVIAPAAKISVKVNTSPQNFSKNITLVTDSSKADPENGIFYMEEKTSTKKANADFEATGQKDVGTNRGAISIPAGSKFTTDSGLVYETTEAAKLSEVAIPSNCEAATVGNSLGCKIKTTIEATVSAKAVENGDKYNQNAGVTLKVPSSGYTATIASGGMTGGTSKIIKIVSEDDVKDAEASLGNGAESEVRSELVSEFNGSYILIGSSFKAKDDKISTSPLQGQEVGEGITPKIIRETTYVIYAVDRDDIDTYIRAQVKQSIGDDTQDVYSTGLVKDGEEGEDKVFFDSYKEEAGKYTAKLKSTVKTGPRVTPEMVAEKSYGVKVGKVKSILTSINGVGDVNIDTSYFWVTSIPSDPNKVEINITVE